MKLIDRVHGDYVATRRARVLSDHLAKIIPRYISYVGRWWRRFGCLFDRSLHFVARVDFNILSGLEESPNDLTALQRRTTYPQR